MNQQVKEWLAQVQAGNLPEPPQEEEGEETYPNKMKRIVAENLQVLAYYNYYNKASVRPPPSHPLPTNTQPPPLAPAHTITPIHAYPQPPT